VWYATNRKPNNVNNDAQGFSSTKDDRVRNGKVFVTIPRDFLERLRDESLWNRWFKSAVVDKLVVDPPLRRSEAVWVKELAREVAESPPDVKHALVYLHGYQTSFENAARRAAALGYQLKVPVTAFFSWPSGGAVAKYLYDKDAIEASETAIAEFLVRVAEAARPTKVHIVAHSMGNQGLIKAIREPVIRNAVAKGLRFGQIILAAPDVTVDLFRQRAGEYLQVADRVTMYASSGDLALTASMTASGFQRAGYADPEPVVVEGIDTITVDNVNLTLLGHSYAVEEMPVLMDMHMLIRRNVAPKERTWLSREKNYWLFK
jgi:esterase/lipase superfamily enzyme